MELPLDAAAIRPLRLGLRRGFYNDFRLSLCPSLWRMAFGLKRTENSFYKVRVVWGMKDNDRTEIEE